MTKTKVQKRGAGRKAEAADRLTAERIHAILSGQDSAVAGRLQTLITKLGTETDAAASDTPTFYADTFPIAAEVVRRGDAADPDAAVKALEAVTAYAERHEPEALKVARRCAEIYEATEGNGASYFAEYVDDVLEGGDDGLMPNPDSKYFAPIFVEAWEDREGRRDRRVRNLLALIKRVDEGADLNALYDEAQRESDEREKAHRPKDTRLVDALSEVLRDPKRSGERVTILETINDLSNELPFTADLHPDIFPTLARVLIREGRAALKDKGLDGYKRKLLRESLRKLQAIADA